MSNNYTLTQKFTLVHGDYTYIEINTFCIISVSVAYYTTGPVSYNGKSIGSVSRVPVLESAWLAV